MKFETHIMCSVLFLVGAFIIHASVGFLAEVVIHYVS